MGLPQTGQTGSSSVGTVILSVTPLRADQRVVRADLPTLGENHGPDCFVIVIGLLMTGLAALEQAVVPLGVEQSALIKARLLLSGLRRFNEPHKRHGGIRQKVLTASLRKPAAFGWANLRRGRLPLPDVLTRHGLRHLHAELFQIENTPYQRMVLRHEASLLLRLS